MGQKKTISEKRHLKQNEYGKILDRRWKEEAVWGGGGPRGRGMEAVRGGGWGVPRPSVSRALSVSAPSVPFLFYFVFASLSRLAGLMEVSWSTVESLQAQHRQKNEKNIQAGGQGCRNVTFTSTFLKFWHSTSIVSRRKHTKKSSQFVGRSMAGGGGPTIQICDVKVPWGWWRKRGSATWRGRRWGAGGSGVGRFGVWVLVCLYCPEFAF